jgi:hypothetical protein
MTKFEIDQLRLKRVLALDLGSGAHSSIETGVCVMEAVAFVAGDPWSDHPECACPVISAFMRAWNDGLPNDADRNRLLRPFIPKLVGSKGSKKVRDRRAWLAVDWTVRVFTPKWLELVPALAEHGSALQAHEEIADLAGLLAAQPKLNAAREASAAAWDAARAAARAAAWDAAWAAAWDAARDAARDAAWDAARAAARAAAWAAAWDAARAAAWDAAWDAARAAARAAAWDAARDAAWDAAWAKLQPTVEWCQVSALDLVERMLAVK